MPVSAGRFIEDDAKPQAGLGDAVVSVDADTDGTPDVSVDPETGAVSVLTPDGGVVVDLNPKSPANDTSDDFDANLAEELEDELNSIAADILEGIEADLTSRKTWE